MGPTMKGGLFKRYLRAIFHFTFDLNPSRAMEDSAAEVRPFLHLNVPKRDLSVEGRSTEICCFETKHRFIEHDLTSKVGVSKGDLLTQARVFTHGRVRKANIFGKSCPGKVRPITESHIFKRRGLSKFGIFEVCNTHEVGPIKPRLYGKGGISKPRCCNFIARYFTGWLGRRSPGTNDPRKSGSSKIDLSTEYCSRKVYLLFENHVLGRDGNRKQGSDFRVHNRDPVINLAYLLNVQIALHLFPFLFLIGRHHIEFNVLQRHPF